jgi:hypothetical protein
MTGLLFIVSMKLERLFNKPSFILYSFLLFVKHHALAFSGRTLHERAVAIKFSECHSNCGMVNGCSCSNGICEFCMMQSAHWQMLLAMS